MRDGKKIAYIPLDDRPCNLKFPQKLAAIANVDLLIPPKELLGHFTSPGDCEKLILWLTGKSPEIDCAIVSLEMLVFGGLIASRNSQIKSNVALKRLNALKKLKESNPQSDVFAFSVIMRDKIKKKNFDIYKSCIQFVEENKIDFFALGEDDVSKKGMHRKEKTELSERINRLPDKNKACVFCGADEIGMMLVSKYLSKKPVKLHIIYSNEEWAGNIPIYEDACLKDSIQSHVSLLGGRIVDDVSGADVLIFINTPVGAQKDLFLDNSPVAKRDYSGFVSRIKKSFGSKKPVCLIDLAYVNGADPGLMNLVLEKIDLEKLTSFAAWNTSCNSIGSGLAHLFLSFSDCKNRKQSNAFLLERVIDDFLYQALLRQRIKLDVEKRAVSPFDLADHFPPVEWAVKNELKNLIASKLSKYIENPEKVEISLPWPRIFEVDCDVSY